MAVYFCWVCGRQCSTSFSDVHYETGRTVYFCGARHAAEYEKLRKL